MIEIQLPPVSNAFHCSAYKIAMSNKMEKQSLFERSIIGMDAIYDVIFYEKDLGIRLGLHINGSIVVHSIKMDIKRSSKNRNIELISPGDVLRTIGAISIQNGDVSLDEVVELLQSQRRPLHLAFESHIALDLKNQMQSTLERLEFNSKLASNFDFNRPSRELVFQTSLEMIIDFSFDLYAWFDPLRVIHLIVFDDVLLITEARDSNRATHPNSRLRVKYIFPLDLLKARDLQSEPDYIDSSFQLVHPSRTFTFVARDEAAKRETLDALTMAIALASIDGRTLTRGWQYQFVTGTLFECALHGKARAIEIIAIRDSSRLHEADVNQWTALFYAAIRNQPRAIYALHRAKSNLNAVDEFKLTPLHYACLYQRPSSVDALIQCGANVHLKDHRGRTPLFLCAINEDPIMHEPIQFDPRASALCIELLVAGGADINAVDSEGLTALERNLCVSVEKCSMLLEAGAKINVYEENNSLLHLACDAPRLTGTPINPALIHLLLQYGAQPNNINSSGQTPMDFLKSSTHPSSIAAVELLVAHGGRAKPKDFVGFEQEVENAITTWKSKRRMIATPDIVKHVNGQKENQIILMQIMPPVSQSSCSICKWKCEWGRQEPSPFKDHLRLGLHSCGICLNAICAPCSTKHIGITLTNPASHAQYDLPQSIRTKRVCDGCFNLSFYAARREAATTYSMRRGRSGSLHTMRVL